MLAQLLASHPLAEDTPNLEPLSTTDIETKPRPASTRR